MGVDARMLALFGERMRPQLRRLSNEQERALKALVARHRQLVEMLVAEQNRLGTASPLLHHALRSHIDFLRKELHQLNHELDQCLRSSPRACCAACPGWGRCCAPRSWPPCQNWAASRAARSPSWSAWRRWIVKAAAGRAAA